jgi:hypothetical protein
LRDVEAAARGLGLQHIVLRAGSEGEIDTAFSTMAQQSGGALDVNVDPFFRGAFAYAGCRVGNVIEQ